LVGQIRRTEHNQKELPLEVLCPVANVMTAGPETVGAAR
jgi:hypothetical protein